MNPFSIFRSIITHRNTPIVLSNTFVVKYHRQVSEWGCFEVSAMDMLRLMKWATSCEKACLKVSRRQILHTLLGDS